MVVGVAILGASLAGGVFDSSAAPVRFGAGYELLTPSTIAATLSAVPPVADGPATAFGHGDRTQTAATDSSVSSVSSVSSGTGSPADSGSAVASTTTIVSPPESEVVPNADWAAFDTATVDALNGSGNLAVSVAVSKDGHPVHAAARGLADPFHGIAVTPTDQFRIASISKVITGTVVLELVADGRLALDQAVLPIIADAFHVTLGDPQMSKVTVRELLGHRSGFGAFEPQFFDNQSVSCEDAAITALTGHLSGTPGGGETYSNMNFCILGLLIEQIAGDGYSTVVDQRLLAPLGITDMHLAGNGVFDPGMVVHAEGAGRDFLDVLDGAGAWVASAPDLVRILDSLDPAKPGWHPLPDDLANLMHQWPQGGGSLGLAMRLWRDGSWGHTGTIESTHSIVLHRQDGYTVAILVSGSRPSETDDLIGYIARGLTAAHLA